MIQPYAQRIRTFGSAFGLESICPEAVLRQMQCAAGAWIDTDIKQTAAEREQEISNLIAIGKSGKANLLIVGSEALLRQYPEDQLLMHISRVKSEVLPVNPNAIVTTAETYWTLLTHPNVMDAVDVFFVNYYPY